MNFGAPKRYIDINQSSEMNQKQNLPFQIKKRSNAFSNEVVKVSDYC